MTWHLKDRELEKNLIKVDPEFLSKLNTACETLDTNKDGDFYKYQTCFVKLNHFGKIIGELFLTRDDIEYKTTYNPHAWNNYPEVTPPKRVLMRIEYKDSEGNLVRECAMFVDVVGAPLPSYWMTANWNGKEEDIVEDAYRIDSNNYLIEDGMKLRFRPWED